ncbi:MAG TPA: G5 domain-containing protein [Candidatus Babeliales bacterium]|nr:G5 domain-containing protein [Candidatus Babeliales bacterium]
MRLLPKPITRHFHSAHRGGKRHVQKRPYIFPILGLLLGGLIVVIIIYTRGGGHTYRPSDSHVVFVFDSGQKRTIDTKAPTVGELVSRMHLNLIPEDVVEPSLDTPIVEDNFRVNIYHARPVTVIDGANKSVTLTAQKSARVVAQGAGLKVNPEDIANFSEGNLKNNVIGEEVVVTRATPINLNLYGGQIPTYTLASSVEQMLREKHIKLENGESVDPGPKTPITPNMQIFVLAKGSQVVTTEDTIPVPTEIVDDVRLSYGATVVRQTGSPGKQLTVYLVNNQAGKEITRKIIQQAIIQAPVPQIVARGTTIDINGDKASIMAAAGISSGDYAPANFIISHESGWRVTAANASGAYGLCQALPGSKMSSAGADWATNPITQLRWCSGYAAKFGGWGGAYSYWLSHHYW